MNTASNQTPKNKDLKEIAVTLYYFWIAYYYGMYVCLRASYFVGVVEFQNAKNVLWPTQIIYQSTCYCLNIYLFHLYI